MADSVQKSSETIKTPEKVVEKKTSEEVVKDVKNGDAEKDAKVEVAKDAAEVVKEDASDSETETVENGDVKQNGTKDSAAAGDVCGIKRKSDVTADTTDAVGKPDKKQKVEESVKESADVASNGDAEAKA